MRLYWVLSISLVKDSHISVLTSEALKGGRYSLELSCYPAHKSNSETHQSTQVLRPCMTQQLNTLTVLFEELCLKISQAGLSLQCPKINPGSEQYWGRFVTISFSFSPLQHIILPVLHIHLLYRLGATSLMFLYWKGTFFSSLTICFGLARHPEVCTCGFCCVGLRFIFWVVC
jgi:hypothetical protein